jgi:hypothetical protein
MVIHVPALKPRFCSPKLLTPLKQEAYTERSIGSVIPGFRIKGQKQMNDAHKRRSNLTWTRQRSMPGKSQAANP